MPDLPAWLTEILRQFPIVAVIGLAIWWTYNRLERREVRQEEQLERRENRLIELHEKLRQDIRQAANAEIERAEKRLVEVLADKNQEVSRLADLVTGELKRLTKEVDQLTKKLSG